MLYSKLPWKNSVVHGIYWMVTMLFMFVLQMTWSWLLAIPGCIAFQYECLLKGLTAHLKSTRHFGFGTTDVMKYYSNMEYSVGLLFENGVSKSLLSLYILASLQQTITSFFIFNVIRNGGGWDEIHVLLFDLLVSLLCKIYFDILVSDSRRFSNF